MADRPIHYSGGVLYRSGRALRGCTHMLPGWPACCYGDRARRIADAGEQSTDPDRVTCARCLDLWRRSCEDAAELRACESTYAARLPIRGACAIELQTLGQVLPREEATLRVMFTSSDRPDGGERDVVLTPAEAERLGRVLLAWGAAVWALAWVLTACVGRWITGTGKAP